jgi:DNA-directed RNA polymerase subunit RPC12/RpoP
MILFCDYCGKEFEKKDYNNIYGTRCPYCGSLIKPVSKPKFIHDIEQKKLKLKKEFLEKMRKRFEEKI